ncbi:hypothetical protein RSAG8_04562, partial [Rhizoctonia solani AG-8 WAC10335]
MHLFIKARKSRRGLSGVLSRLSAQLKASLWHLVLIGPPSFSAGLIYIQSRLPNLSHSAPPSQPSSLASALSFMTLSCHRCKPA